MTTSPSEHPSPYTALPEAMSEQDWRNAVSLLLLRVKELEARLPAVETFRRHVEELEARLTEVETSCSNITERVPVEQAPATPL